MELAPLWGIPLRSLPSPRSSVPVLRQRASGPSRAIQLLMLSAKTSSALETVTVHLAKHFKQHPDLNLADAAYTLHVGRRAFDYRRTVVCRDLDDAISALETLDPGRVSTA